MDTAIVLMMVCTRDTYATSRFYIFIPSILHLAVLLRTHTREEMTEVCLETEMKYSLAADSSIWRSPGKDGPRRDSMSYTILEKCITATERAPFCFKIIHNRSDGACTILRLYGVLTAACSAPKMRVHLTFLLVTKHKGENCWRKAFSNCAWNSSKGPLIARVTSGRRIEILWCSVIWLSTTRVSQLRKLTCNSPFGIWYDLDA